MADWVASLDIDGWSLGVAVLTAIATWVIVVLARKGTRRLLAEVPALTPALQTLIVLHLRFWHHPLHGVAVRSSVVDAVADALAARSLDAVVTSDVPTAPLTPADRI